MLKTTAHFVRSLKPNVLVRVMVPSVDRSLRTLASLRFQRQIERTLSLSRQERQRTEQSARGETVGRDPFTSAC